MNLFAVWLASCSVTVFASSDIYLKITDTHGVSQVFKCPDGACVVNNLKKGTYNVAIELQTPDQGSAAKGSTTKESTTGEGRKDSLDVLQLNASVISPRDAGSGMATGRRQYSPVIIRKDMAKGAEIIVAEDDSTLSVVGLAVSANSSQSSKALPVQRTVEKK
jgi:hypothetical protein